MEFLFSKYSSKCFISMEDLFIFFFSCTKYHCGLKGRPDHFYRKSTSVKCRSPWPLTNKGRALYFQLYWQKFKTLKQWNQQWRFSFTSEWRLRRLMLYLIENTSKVNRNIFELLLNHCLSSRNYALEID